jgi:hypothetical protein
VRTGTASGGPRAPAGAGLALRSWIRPGGPALALLLLVVPAGAAVLRGPYLQLVTPETAVVRWRTDQAVESRLRFGARPGRLDQVAVVPGPRTEHDVTLGGLRPDTVYGYVVLEEPDDGNEASVPQGAFRTSPPPGSGRPARIWVLGDSGTADSTARAVRDAFLGFAADRAPDLLLMLGDNAYPSGTDFQYQQAVFDVFGQALGRWPLWPTIGNHDAMSLDMVAGTGPYFDAFSLPAAGEAGGVPSGTEAYYSFDHGAVHFVVLDSSGPEVVAGSPMLDWLAADLAATTQPWLVAFWHHPPYSRGSHDSDSEPRMIAVRTQVLPILEAGGVDLVLTGHSHAYERSALLDGHYGSSASFDASVLKDAGDGRVGGDGPYDKPAGRTPRAGAVYVVAGSSGRVVGGPLDHPAMVASLAVAGSLVLDVDGSRLDVTFLDQGGQVRDHFTIRKGSTGGVSAPASLVARRAGRLPVRLSWEDTSPGGAGFLVERSADGVAFQAVGSTGPAETTFVDDLTEEDGSPYYRVRALGPPLSDPSNTASLRRPAPAGPSR